MKLTQDNYSEKEGTGPSSLNDHKVREYSQTEGRISANDFETRESSLSVQPNRGSSRIKSRDTYSYGQMQPFSYSSFPENTGSYSQALGEQRGTQQRDPSSTYYLDRGTSKNDFNVGQSFSWLVSPPTKYIFSNNTGGVVGC